MIRMEYRKLRDDELEALVAFAKAHGRTWKNILSMTYWYNARLWKDGPGGERMGSVLHGIRNEFGGSWLYDRFKLPSEVTNVLR